MAAVVLVAWIIQGAVGLTLFLDWLRREPRRGARTVIPHVLLTLAGLLFWVGFTVTGALAAAWISFAIITAGNIFGDTMLLGRARRIAPDATTIRQRYAVAIVSIFRRALPRRVSFHAVFSAVVYFPCLGVCVGATVAALSG
jgi:hypothetical protein